MADGAVVVGVVGILTSGVLGPLVLHHANKERDSRQDQRNALDAATEPLAAARGQIAWLQMHDPEGDEWAERYEEMYQQLHLVTSHSLRLKMRFGPRTELTKAYAAAGHTSAQQAHVLWDEHGGQMSSDDAAARFDEVDLLYVDAYERFVAECRRWYEDTQWPYGKP